MDPELRQALVDGDTERAAELRQNLQDWERRGGFLPHAHFSIDGGSECITCLLEEQWLSSWHEAISNAAKGIIES